MKCRFLGLLMVVLLACGDGTVPSNATVTVVDHDTGQGLDSARVSLYQVYVQENRRSLVKVYWTGANGQATVAFNAVPGYQYEVETSRNHYEPVLSPDGGSYDNLQPVLPGESNEVTLLLQKIPPPDPDRFQRLYERIAVGALIDTLRQNRWHWVFLPRLFPEDIPALLAAGDDSLWVSNYPLKPTSTYRPDTVRAGLVALWLVEAIRRAELQQRDSLLQGVVTYPSRAPVLGTNRGNPSGYNSVNTVLKAAEAYRKWYAGFETDSTAIFRRNPLSGTGYGWM